MPRPFTGCISVNWRLTRLGVRRRRWLLPIFVRTSMPVPVTRKRFAVALCVLILYFPSRCLRGTVNLLSHKIPRILHTSADVEQFDQQVRSAQRGYFFLGGLPGASTINMVRPSSAGACSTMATSAKSSATSLRSVSAISG